MAPLKNRAFEAIVTASVVVAVVIGSVVGLNVYLAEIDGLFFPNSGNEFGHTQLALLVFVMLLADIFFLLLALIGLVYTGASILKMSQREIVSAFVPMPSPIGLRWLEALIRRLHSAIAR